MEAGVVLILILVYFLPTFICVGREHPSKTAIIVLNILAGWTFLGWLVAIVWSFTSPNAPASPPVRPAAETSRTGSSSHGNVADQLEKLAQLKEKGILDDEEFAREKAKLLR